MPSVLGYWAALNAMGEHLTGIERVRVVFLDEVTFKARNEGYGSLHQVSGGWGMSVERMGQEDYKLGNTGRWFLQLLILYPYPTFYSFQMSHLLFKMVFPTLNTWQTPKHPERPNSNTTSWGPGSDSPGQVRGPPSRLLSCSIDGTCEFPKDRDYTCFVHGYVSTS